ncbi:MAG: exonuclease domain-containing protein [Planctomycetes bacterium]|nr:exonuclease domain-containing protein [Planctomycetota bacterium]
MTKQLYQLNNVSRTRYVVVDLEATCWEQKGSRLNEIIEIGAVAFEVGRGVVDEFQIFVKPRENPVLSEFCTELTTIRQEDVDRAELYPAAFEKFCYWAEQYSPYILASWGDYDLRQLNGDCVLHGIEYDFESHISLKSAFANIMGCKKCGMGQALRKTGIPLDGTHHRGIDDARNIAKLLDFMLKKVGVIET